MEPFAILQELGNPTPSYLADRMRCCRMDRHSPKAAGEAPDRCDHKHCAVRRL